MTRFSFKMRGGKHKPKVTSGGSKTLTADVKPMSKSVTNLRGKGATISKELELTDSEDPELVTYPVDNELKEVSSLIRHYYNELNYLVDKHNDSLSRMGGVLDFNYGRNNGFPEKTKWDWIHASTKIAHEDLTGPEYADLSMTWIEAQITKTYSRPFDNAGVKHMDHMERECMNHYLNHSLFYGSDCSGKVKDYMCESCCARSNNDVKSDKFNDPCEEEIQFSSGNLISTEDRKRMFGRPIVLEMLRVTSILFCVQSVWTSMREVKCTGGKTLEVLLTETCQDMINDFYGVEGLLPDELFGDKDPLHLQNHFTLQPAALVKREESHQDLGKIGLN
mmetsp:Transcript_13560/g.16826  ORF Transcript_13560/g.16826 Transcript_13560/m.16826 type:complete len:335 (-) Transcript_13560:1344-2348(-)|eukprot:CAMPEP_0204871060 /NCGR_PEP_ID=MMETSP1348-20121228/34396_1 /ASSEMBLY_ACC=CAM_ASM_000700 /TAXON_ID=215587 /ORGANISM="Aplanochytrium stocchinoi, Strain GSBS06" /LENGTH=334 /DNA_ID=CAMNT_0052025197 /DNA_START=444 /DNA_END=1448 /DNA_ORIENTATION=-